MEKITILITTYNLEKYIRKSIDSILMQKTQYKYKIVIADDASTDGTAEILEEYKRKYPDTIDLILNKTNMGSLKNSNQLFENVQSEYFSFLDGDDYWIDENKMQEQIDFLDNNIDCSMCGGNTIYVQNGTRVGEIIKKQYLDKCFTYADYLEQKAPFVHTSSLILRNVIFKNGLPPNYREVIGTFEECAIRGEDFRFITHLKCGNLKVMSRNYSCYNIHEGGIWQGTSNLKKLLEIAITNYYYYKLWNGFEKQIYKQRFITSYKNLMSCIWNENKIMDSFNLTENECFLLTELLRDISKNQIRWEEKPKFLKKLRKKMLFFFDKY